MSHSLITNNLRKQESSKNLDKPKKEDQTPPKNNNKFRSPSSNTAVKNKNIAINRYKEVFIDNPDEEFIVTNNNYQREKDSNPFTNAYNKNKIVDSCNYKSNSNSNNPNLVDNNNTINANKMNSIGKKKTNEVMTPSSTLGKTKK